MRPLSKTTTITKSNKHENKNNNNFHNDDNCDVLYHFSNSAKVTEGREKDDPDLYFNNQGVEVKSWSTNKGLHGLGRFGADKENLSLLSLIFGFSALVSVFDGEGELPKTVNPTNFRGFQLTAAMEKVKEFKNLLNKNSD